MSELARWRVELYERRDGSSPVVEFIEKQSVRNQAKILAEFDDLAEFGLMPRGESWIPPSAVCMTCWSAVTANVVEGGMGDMDYEKYRDQRLQQDAELAEAYAQESLEREIGRQILKLRQMRGWTQAQLAEALDTKQSAVARLESGSHRPSLATLNRVCEVLDAQLEVRLTPCS